MSATYRIEIRRDAHSDSLPWDAAIIRLSDDERVTIVVGKTPWDVMEAAREWVRDEEGVTGSVLDLSWHGSVLHVDDQGRDAEAPQSVKV